eukprot:gene5042-8638_t
MKNYQKEETFDNFLSDQITFKGEIDEDDDLFDIVSSLDKKNTTKIQKKKFVGTQFERKESSYQELVEIEELKRKIKTLETENISLKQKSTFYSLLIKLEENDISGYTELHSIFGIKKQFKLLDISITEDFSFNVHYIILKYIENSLNFKSFIIELKKRKQALKIYIGILKQEKENEKLTKLYQELNMKEELLLQMISTKKLNEDDLFDLFENCLQFSTKHNLFFYSNIFIGLINLLNFKVENNLNLSLNTTNSIIEYHIKQFKKQKVFKMNHLEFISPKRILFAKMNTFLMLGQYSDFKNLYIYSNSSSNSWFSKSKNIFSYQFFVNFLSDFQKKNKSINQNSFEELFEFLIKQEKDLQMRLFYSVDHGVYRVAIKTCLEMKDKEELFKLKRHIQKYVIDEDLKDELLLKIDTIDTNHISWVLKKFI